MSKLKQQGQGAYWCLHGKEGHNLQQVVLDDVSDDAVLVKIAAAALCAKVFAEDDLDIADKVPAPQRLEHQVGKSQHLHHVHPTLNLFMMAIFI